jgi:hypothetical protein
MWCRSIAGISSSSTALYAILPRLFQGLSGRLEVAQEKLQAFNGDISAGAGTKQGIDKLSSKGKN